MKQIHSNYSFDNTQAVHIQRMDGYSPVISMILMTMYRRYAIQAQKYTMILKNFWRKLSLTKHILKNSIQLQEVLLQSNTILVLQLLSQAQTTKW